MKICKNCGKEILKSKIKGIKVFSKRVFCTKKCQLEYRHKNCYSKTKHEIMRRFIDMKSRCYKKNSCNYKNYGGRGIKICDEWLNSFESFYKWSIENGYRKELSIDKIDNNGNYEPTNCRWTTKRIQNINKNATYKNTTGFVGIRKHSSGKYFYGSVKLNNKDCYTGMNKDIIIAAIMRNNYIIDNKLDNQLNDLSKYKNSYDMEIRYGK